jgi:hypothetical protein
MDQGFAEVHEQSRVEAMARLNELRAEQERLKRVKQLKQSYGLDFYRPHWKQDKFHAAGDKVGRYCRTGNRGGKTTCGSAQDVAWLLGGRTWYKKLLILVDENGGLDINGSQNRELDQGCRQPVGAMLVVNDR